MAKESLGLLGYDSFHFAVHDAERSRSFYAEKLDFRLIATSSEAAIEARGERSDVYAAGDARVVVTRPERDDSQAAKYLRRHPAGVTTLAFTVRDAAHTLRVLESRGATVLAELEEDTRDGGHYRAFEVATPLGEVRFRFVERENYPLFSPSMRAVPHDDSPNRFGIALIDHITSNMRTMAPHLLWLEHVLGFERYWDVKFHTDDLRKGAGSGLKSTVMWDPESGIKFANNEPLRPRWDASQIAKFVDDNAGAGVQHAALLMNDLVSTVRDLRENGVEFLGTPGSYYDALPERMAERKVSNLVEDIETLRALQILVDGRDDKYMTQIFMKEAALLYSEREAGPFFFELIARRGYPGFGEGNFRALFDAIEREQTHASGNLDEQPVS
ncbi:MAG: VOC family protein [Deltaproteobacteria bacterium]|nr:VOC family protein [Deltaproteobacteria bacterium]